MVSLIICIEDLRGQAGFSGQDDVPVGLKCSEEHPWSYPGDYWIFMTGKVHL